MKRSIETVEVSVGKDVYPRQYERTELTTLDEIIEFGRRDESKALKLFNYALDLEKRNEVRAEILKNEAAQASLIEKQVRDVIKQRASVGKPVSEEQARKIVEFMQTMEV